MAPLIIQITKPEDAGAAVAQAAQVILSGGLVAVPTESFYGLAADAMNPSALKRLLKVKRIIAPHPILTLIPSVKILGRYTRRVPPLAEILMQAFWPGGLTLVLEASEDVPSLLTAGTGRIGVRLSSHPLAAGLAQAAGVPITGTSANVTGEPPCISADDVVAFLGEEMDLVLDGGKTEGGKGSTVLDVAADPPKMLREGMIGRDQLRRFLPGL